MRSIIGIALISWIFSAPSSAHAIKTSGLSRERKQQHHHRKIQSTTTSSASKGKGSSPGVTISTFDKPTTEGSGCNCDAPKDGCTVSEPGQEVQCFDVISNHRILHTSLGCATAEEILPEELAPRPVITVQGPDGVLECSGNGDNLIFDPTPRSTNNPSIGVRLVNGGRLVNCHIAGFHTGVQMVGMGNNAVVGTKYF